MSHKSQTRELRRQAVLNRTCREAEAAGWKQVKVVNGVVRGREPGKTWLSRYVPKDPLLAEFLGFRVVEIEFPPQGPANRV